MKQFGISVARCGETVTVSLSGGIFYGGGVHLLRETLSHLASDDIRHIIIDLRRAIQIDGAGLGMLAYYHGVNDWRGIRQEVVNADPRIKQMFRAARLDALLGRDDDEAASGVAEWA